MSHEPRWVLGPKEGYVDRLRRNERLRPVSHDIVTMALLLMVLGGVAAFFLVVTL